MSPLLQYTEKMPLPVLLNPHRSLLIFDEVLLTKKAMKNWLGSFPYRYPVKSGEGLKDAKGLSKHLEKIALMVSQIPERPLQVICCGGGSVGDFAGFVASILKRGVDLIQVPSTWLAAMDSAHGGKNALNVGRIKNQIGTFHIAKEVWMVREILMSQPRERVQESLGEALKIALIEGGGLWSKVESLKEWDAKTLWSLLPELVQAKYRVVRKDPLEKKGIRHVLNLGHTVGHVLEAQLSIPHGKAVHWGVQFALKWSEQRGLLTEPEVLQTKFLKDGKHCRQALSKLRSPARHLAQDKKRVASGQIRFVFLKAPGKPVVLPVQVAEILEEIRRQS